MEVYTILAGIGTGAIIGFIVGYALRKVLGLILIMVGLFIVGLAVLVYNNIASVNFLAIERLLSELFLYGMKTGNEVIDKVFSGTPFTVGLISGLGLGFFKSGGLKIIQLGEDKKKRRVIRDA